LQALVLDDVHVHTPDTLMASFILVTAFPAWSSGSRFAEVADWMFGMQLSRKWFARASGAWHEIAPPPYASGQVLGALGLTGHGYCERRPPNGRVELDGRGEPRQR
jgi:hypothetical protein